MGLAKKIAIVGGCTIGGIILAPAVATIATSTLICTGAGAALSAAEAILFASSTAIGAAGAGTGAAAGGAISASQDIKEKKDEVKLDTARREGYNAASAIYEEKFKKQADAFFHKEKSFKENTLEYQSLINDMQNYISTLEEELKTATSDKDNLIQLINYMKEKMAELEGLKNS